MGMTKKVVTSLLLSTALLPMLSGKADTVKTNSKGTAVSKDSTSNAASDQQVTLGTSTASQASTSATSTTVSQAAVSDNSATSQASDATSTSTSVASRATVRASVSASATDTTMVSQSVQSVASTTDTVSVTSQSAQSATSTTDKATTSAASETAATTASAADQLNSRAEVSATSSAESVAKESTAQSVADTTSSTAKVEEQQSTSTAAQNTIMAASATSRMTKSTTSQDQFLSEIKAGAISGWYKYQVLPSVTAAQAILESGWGKSQLATVGNNLFGIKGSYQGQSVYFPTQEWTGTHYITIQDAFRKYPNWSASVEDHGAFLAENSRYNNLIGVTDYKKVASLLQQDGYATAPTYASSLISIIEYNKLDAWDREVLSGQTTGGSNSNNGNGTQTNNNVTAASGTYKFTKTTTIHNTADQNSAVVGTYNAGESVSYNGKLTVNNATWLRYQSYSGVARYVMISQQSTNNNNQQAVTPASGSFKFTAKTNIRESASKTAKVVGTYNTGDTVYYNGKLTTGGQTWLRYLSASGSQRYVAMSGDEVGTNTTTKPNVTAATGSYKFTQTTAIKNSPATTATTVGSYNKGDTVYYNGKVTVGNQTWLRYRSYSGTDHYVQMQTSSSTTNVTKPQVTAQSGAYKFTQSTAIKSTPDSKTASVGTYNAGDTVYYNAKVVANGQTWLRYQSYSGKQHYVAVGGSSNTSSTTSSNQTTSQSGAYRFTTTTNIRTAPSTKSAVVGHYNANETVYYNGSVKAEGYTWLRYLSRSGAVHYVAVVK